MTENYIDYELPFGFQSMYDYRGEPVEALVLHHPGEVLKRIAYYSPGYDDRLRDWKTDPGSVRRILFDQGTAFSPKMQNIFGFKTVLIEHVGFIPLEGLGLDLSLDEGDIVRMAVDRLCPEVYTEINNPKPHPYFQHIQKLERISKMLKYRHDRHTLTLIQKILEGS
jgi:hypothetical protein